MRCGSWLLNLLRRRPNARRKLEVPYELAPREIVARILYSKRHFNPSRMRPNAGAFIPPPDAELSGVHVTGLSEAAIWEVAKTTVGTEPGRTTIYARADVLVNEFIRQKLRAIRDDKPFIRHTSVKGWPKVVDLNQQKERWKAICLALSESPNVSLILPAAPIRTDES